MFFWCCASGCHGSGWCCAIVRFFADHGAAMPTSLHAGF